MKRRKMEKKKGRVREEALSHRKECEAGIYSCNEAEVFSSTSSIARFMVSASV